MKYSHSGPSAGRSVLITLVSLKYPRSSGCASVYLFFICQCFYVRPRRPGRAGAGPQGFPNIARVTLDPLQYRTPSVDYDDRLFIKPESKLGYKTIQSYTDPRAWICACVCACVCLCSPSRACSVCVYAESSMCRHVTVHTLRQQL